MKHYYIGARYVPYTMWRRDPPTCRGAQISALQEQLQTLHTFVSSSTYYLLGYMYTYIHRDIYTYIHVYRYTCRTTPAQQREGTKPGTSSATTGGPASGTSSGGLDHSCGLTPSPLHRPLPHPTGEGHSYLAQDPRPARHVARQSPHLHLLS
jgi:hypothetical protein